MKINLRNILLQTFKDYIENNPESKLAKKYTLEQFEKATEILQVGEVALRKACNQTIDLCAENVRIESVDTRFNPHKIDDWGMSFWADNGNIILRSNKQSILDTKNQIV